VYGHVIISRIFHKVDEIWTKRDPSDPDHADDLAHFQCCIMLVNNIRHWSRQFIKQFINIIWYPFIWCMLPTLINFTLKRHTFLWTEFITIFTYFNRQLLNLTLHLVGWWETLELRVSFLFDVLALGIESTMFNSIACSTVLLVLAGVVQCPWLPKFLLILSSYS